MKARPILFSGPMVRALLDGRKTQTRREVKPQPVKLSKSHLPLPLHPDDWAWSTRHGSNCSTVSNKPTGPAGWREHCPYGQPGDLLAVKEAAWMWCERRPNGVNKRGRQKWHYVPLSAAPVHFQSDHPTKPEVRVVSPDTGNEWCWRLKVGRFLPRWASRLTLEITGVRVERLQDISEADAKAEGCVYVEAPPLSVGYHPAYRDLWESINGPGSWAANPWVWVLEFKPHQVNVDDYLRRAA